MDTGWILIPNEKYNDFAVKCECQEKGKKKQDISKNGFTRAIEKCTFSTYETWNENSKRAKEVAKNYFLSFEKIKNTKNNSILLAGQVGSGKTHLAVAIALNLLKRHHKVEYMPYRDEITKLKQNIINSQYYEKAMDKYKTCEVLLIDDLFKGKPTDTDINIIFEIVNHRYMAQLPMIISTELTRERLLMIDEAIGSRIIEMSKLFLVQIERNPASNYRLKS